LPNLQLGYVREQRLNFEVKSEGDDEIKYGKKNSRCSKMHISIKGKLVDDSPLRTV